MKQLKITEYYHDLISRMKEDGYYSTVINALLNGSHNMNQSEIAPLEQMGYLKRLDNGSYLSFCQDFTEYVKTEYVKNSLSFI